MKTELTEFCHQFKIKEPVYKRIEEGNSKAFVCKCTVTITDEESKFAKLEYSEKGEGLNTKNSTGEAAKKVLLAIYKDNVALWRKFREIKIKKKIVTWGVVLDLAWWLCELSFISIVGFDVITVRILMDENNYYLLLFVGSMIDWKYVIVNSYW